MIDIMKTFDMEMLVKLTVSAVLGLAIGLERELKRKPLGLKTSLVISIVSCLLTIVSIQSSYLFPASDFVKIQMDPLRLAAQIVSGIGFLGAGVILRKEDDTISGLTTAAMVWGAAGIGIATGAGFYIEAMAGVVLLIISVELIPSLIKMIGLRKLHAKELSLKLILKNRRDIPEVINELKEYQMKIDHFHIKELADSTYLLHLKVRVNYREDIYDFYNNIAKIDEVYRPEISG
ncbi:putative Mg2+ transporter-C (MgtC) family protein [Bacillus sp. OV322]|uniref:MgtC/SapB family protein n=1 Tax=Bacillus sp. OV322 TaxID=1882764 RepID=UPI0008E99FC7|nr:putative Mg2+ transporter-C (MgtC) family protein [Bacillus sp. OV322]